MQIIRENIVFRLLCLVLALHILNFSVDTPDFQPEQVPEDLTYNDMESIMEVVLEQVLEINNAIAEHEENDTDEGNGGFSVKKSIDFSYYDTRGIVLFLATNYTVCSHNNYQDNFSSKFHPELVPPPPKA